MKLWSSGCAVLLSILLSGDASAALKPGDKITGVREWQFTDGTKKRARINISRAGKIWVGGDGVMSFKLEVDRSVPEQKEILEMVERGKVELVDPGVPASVSTLVGEIDWSNPLTFHLLMGYERQWSRTDGKIVKGALLNVADDEISLKIGNTAWRVPISTLSEEDKAYLDRIVRSQEPCIPRRVDCPSVGFSNGEFEETPIWVSGERFLEAKGPRVSFEDALKIASDHLAQRVDRKKWSVFQILEHNFTLSPEALAKLPNLKIKPVRRGYQICFMIDEGSIPSAKAKLDDRVTSNGWHSVYVLDDGSLMEVKITK